MKKKNIKSVFKSFEKFYRDEEDCLTIPVSVISDEIVDRDGEVVTAEAMKNAMDEYMEFANIREMHQPIAIGTTKRIWQEGKKTLISCQIVAEEAIKKIERGVLKGFSIGFIVIEKIGNIYTKIKIIEISAVDIPANYSALIGSKSYEPMNKNLLEEEYMDKENDNNVAQDQATQKANNDVATPTQTDVPAQADTVSKDEVQALEAEAIDQLTKELEEVKKSFEALKAEATAKEEEFTSTKEAAKGYKSLSVVHKKYKEENEQLKAEMVTLKAELEALKNAEVNIKSATPGGTVVSKGATKEIDFSQFEAKDVPAEFKDAVTLAKALIKLNK